MKGSTRQSRDETLEELERVSARFSHDHTQRGQLLAAAEALLADFLPSLETRSVFCATNPDDVARADELDPREKGQAAAKLFEVIDRQVAQDGLHEGSPRFFAFIPGGGLYASAVADYVAAALNRYAGVEYAAPGAARLERRVLKWLIREAGFPEDTSAGDLTSGGSIANLSAIVAAREAHAIRGRDVENAVVYVSAVTHHSLLKALSVAGMREAQVRFVPVDDSYRMQADALVGMIEEDRAAGLHPWLIGANAGATDTGGVDPLDALADIAAASSVWLHVDAAYGGAFVLCDEGQRRLRGMSRADSLTLDPHKGLFLPFGSGAVLVRDAKYLYAAHHARGAYMQDLGNEYSPETASACDFSPELSRPFRGLRLWFPLQLYGVETFRAALSEKLLLAEHAYEALQDIPYIELGPPPDLSIFVFRFLPSGKDANAFNRTFADALRDDGRVYLSSTSLDGRFLIRMAILNHHTHRRHIDQAVQAIREVSGALLANND